MFTSQDIDYIIAHGLEEDSIKQQLRAFENGVAHTQVVRAASVGNGIEVCDIAKQKELTEYYDNVKEQKDIVKFVPASGAATRMFQFLYAFLDAYHPEEEVLSSYIKLNGLDPLKTFFDHIKYFPFTRAVRKEIRKQYPDYKQSDKGIRMHTFVSLLLDKNGLNYGSLPKGLIPFHKYAKYTRTAFEEQLYEATQYAAVDGVAHLHFTFSPNHLTLFKKAFEKVKKRIIAKTKIEVRISYSFQDASTDTIAVDLENKPFKTEDGNLVFRPSGHGALIKNLNDVDADIIFIKNIDNVTVEEHIRDVAASKKMLAGRMLQLQHKIFGYLDAIVKQEVTDGKLSEMKTFLWKELHIKDIPETKAGIAEILNRPIRVCGVVKNTGAPGGGPFWVKNAEGQLSLQIVELSQIDKSDSRQAAIIKDATHFNPVDLVCGTRNYIGEKYNLNHFINPLACFITNKSIDGMPIKALEAPGLWNGAMEHWNTIFVEVPSLTFSPVKNVNDLLDPA
ncbi:MAG: hypothetical protein ACI849_001078, partial [Patiriisocius sp.]